MGDGFTTWAFTGTEHFYAENIYFHTLGMTGHTGKPASGYAENSVEGAETRGMPGCGIKNTKNRGGRVYCER